jgi:hypothetical protein
MWTSSFRSLLTASDQRIPKLTVTECLLSVSQSITVNPILCLASLYHSRINSHVSSVAYGVFLSNPLLDRTRKLSTYEVMVCDVSFLDPQVCRLSLSADGNRYQDTKKNRCFRLVVYRLRVAGSRNHKRRYLSRCNPLAVSRQYVTLIFSSFRVGWIDTV